MERFYQSTSKWFPYPTNTTFPTTISTFSGFPTTTNATTIPTISTIPTTTTTPTTIVTTTTTTNFTSTKLTTTTFAGFCSGNATFTTTSTKKEKRKKKPARPTTNQERVPWTKEEEEKLAEAWVAASEDPIVGDRQTYGSFWEKVQAIFYELMESQTRNADQITSKWRDIRLKCTDFGGIYNNLLNIRKSDSNDFDVFKAAMDQYEKTTPTRKAFPYMKLWLKLKDSPKWKEQTEGSSQSSGSKRSRNPDGTSQQSDGRTHIDINDNPIDLETDQPLPRPVGRNKAKKAASTSSNSTSRNEGRVMTRMEQKMIEAQTSFQEAQETLQTKTDMEILKMKADDLEGEDLEHFQAMKESVRARRRRRGFYLM
uniref:Myb-like domain-containing protein n=1 Tax=Lactuca sativa TaxID=4236 RepID=A0A9R1URZ4_LACSA|nr:hypothetical protein LSAT_V11C800443190 [Lactuca sativa]